MKSLQIGLITRSCLREYNRHPHVAGPALDSKGRLMVGAAVGTRDSDRERVKRLFHEAEVDVVVIDSSQGNSSYQLEMLKEIKRTCPGSTTTRCMMYIFLLQDSM